MKRRKRGLTGLLALLMLLSIVTGCGEKQVDTLQLRITTTDVPNTLDPAMVDTDTEKTVAVHLFENLMKPTDSGAACGQAKNYTCVDNLDGTETYRFILRTDNKWSDGKAVTAQDFVYAWRRLVDPETASPNRELLNMVAGYEKAAEGDLEALQVWAEDTLTLVVVLNCHCPYFLSSICTAAATMPVRADAVEQENWSVQRQTLLTNGAYRVSDWVENDLTLSAMDTYYDTKRIEARELLFRFGVAQEAAMSYYENGEIDVVMESDQTEDSRLSYRSEVQVLLVNQMAGMLRKEELRQAMSLVLDRNAICAELGEHYIPADGLVPYGTASTEGGDFRTLSGAIIDNNPEDYEANCAAAKEKLAQINYVSPVSASPISEPVDTIPLLHTNFPMQVLVAQTLQKTWQEKLGLHVTLQEVTTEEMQSALESGEFVLALTSIDSDRSDASAYLKRFRSDSRENYGMYYSNPYDMLMRVTESANSLVARDAYMEDAERMLLESGHVIPLYNDTHNWLVRKDLVGALDNGQGVHCFTYVRLTEE